MKEYKDILCEALNEIKETELEKLPAESEIEHEFSDKFEKNIKKLINNQNKKTHSKKFRKTIIILVAAILAMLIASSAVAEQNKFLDFLYRIRNDDVLFIYDKKQEETTTEVFKECFYTLNFVPEEYEQTELIQNKEFNDMFIHWKKSDDKKHIYFDQGKTVGTIGINTQGNYVEEININSVDVICVERDENISCFWKEKGYYFKLSYPKELGKNFIMKNAGKLIEFTE